MALSPLAQWVKQAVARVGSQAEMARLLTKEIRRDIDRAAVNKMCLGLRAVAADELLAMEGISGLGVPSPHVPARVPLIDWVSASRLVEPRSQIPVEDVPLLAFADLGRGEFFALRVGGTSMDRISPDGSVIVVNRADKTLISGKPYIFAVRGETTFKLWHADPEYLDPHSWDSSHKPIFVKKKKDLEVVGRVKRTILEL